MNNRIALKRAQEKRDYSEDPLYWDDDYMVEDESEAENEEI
jgi:hypothetical protein